MTRHIRTLQPDYFAGCYADDPDPWRFATSPYEAAKYAATCEALPKPRYGSALEVGCSIGVLTQALAERCDALVAVDAAEAALDRARARCRDLPQVSFAGLHVPTHWPLGRFDLILLSEVVYYLDAADVARLVARVRDSLRPDGDVVLVHWTGETHYPLSGDEAAELFIREAGAAMRVSHQARTACYRLDVLQACPADALAEV